MGDLDCHLYVYALYMSHFLLQRNLGALIANCFFSSYKLNIHVYILCNLSDFECEHGHVISHALPAIRLYSVLRIQYESTRPMHKVLNGNNLRSS